MRPQKAPNEPEAMADDPPEYASLEGSEESQGPPRPVAFRRVRHYTADEDAGKFPLAPAYQLRRPADVQRRVVPGAESGMQLQVLERGAAHVQEDGACGGAEPGLSGAQLGEAQEPGAGRAGLLIA
eukprot:scaffold434_cov186-Pinguiococcus_pyrenoidosus.AAC.90